MRLSVVLIACVLAGGVLFVGLKLSSAIGQVSAISIPPAADVGRAAATGMDSAAAPAYIGASADTNAAPDAAEFDPAPSIDEQELLRDYFGPEVSLNDIGQLAVPDPEFERAFRERANEIGEIQAEP